MFIFIIDNINARDITDEVRLTSNSLPLFHIYVGTIEDVYGFLLTYFFSDFFFFLSIKQHFSF